MANGRVRAPADVVAIRQRLVTEAAEATARRQVLAELGLPEHVVYRRVTLGESGRAAEPLRWERVVIAPDGRTRLGETFTTPGRWKPAWAGYTVAVYVVDEVWAASVVGPALERWTLHPDWEALPLCHVRCTVRHGDSLVYLDTRRCRDGTWPLGLAGLEHAGSGVNTDAVRKKALAGRPMLYAMGPTKTEGAGVPTLEVFLTRIEQACPGGEAPDGTRSRPLGGRHGVTKREVADAVGIGVTTLDGRIERYRRTRGVDLDWMTRLRPALRAWGRGRSLFALLGVETPGKPGFSGRPAGG